MEDDYKIYDTRISDELKKKSFGGFKKSEVYSVLFKSIENKKIVDASFWIAECIVSGYTIDIWEKLLIFASKKININHPELPTYLEKKNKIFNNQINRIKSNNKEDYLFLRNSQMIRNLFQDIVTILSTSPNNERYDQLPKINEIEDFRVENIQKNIISKMNILPDSIIHFSDPDELKLIMNELYTNLKNKLTGYDKSLYWVSWILTWEKHHKKNKNHWNISEREISNIKKKYRCDVIWVLWDTILEECKLRDSHIENQIKSLYNLYLNNYIIGKKYSRLYYLYNAIAYLTHNINFNNIIKYDKNLFIKTQLNVNKWYALKKKNEINTNNKKINKRKINKEREKKEIINEKLKLFNNLI